MLPELSWLLIYISILPLVFGEEMDSTISALLDAVVRRRICLFLKNAVFWDFALCGSFKDRRFGGP
jgi:hypothetical protein